ncbi:MULTISPECIES: HAD hydrolase family protein [Sphingomonadaceae]|uniref:HAD hydrolase family protein n=2 Tax=Alphaproteobacteria TaxID=28211 RepID=UPI003918FDB5
MPWRGRSATCPMTCPLLVRTGLSIAMGKTPEEIRSAAHYISTSNDKDGIADAIDAFLLPLVGDHHEATGRFRPRRNARAQQAAARR